jgi:flagellar biosynthesis GTPase FlhF
MKLMTTALLLASTRAFAPLRGVTTSAAARFAAMAPKSSSITTAATTEPLEKERQPKMAFVKEKQQRKAQGTLEMTPRATTIASQEERETETQPKIATMAKAEMGKVGKDYSYRSTWKHKYSRAKNLAQRGGLTKQAMMEQYGRFPKRKEWWGPEENEKEWSTTWISKFPKPAGGGR